MRIKRFDNLWTMGLILFGAILAFFYVAKIFFPQLIVGVAEIPSVVAFGNYVDSHLWAFYTYHACVGLFGGYFYYCACARTYKMTKKQVLLFVSFVVLGLILQRFLPSIYTPYTYVMLVSLPFVMLLIEGETNYKTFRSTAVCFAVDIMAQAFSLEIRNIVMMARAVNSATITILMIDAIIWRVLLYLYFNKDKGV